MQAALRVGAQQADVLPLQPLLRVGVRVAEAVAQSAAGNGGVRRNVLQKQAAAGGFAAVVAEHQNLAVQLVAVAFDELHFFGIAAVAHDEQGVFAGNHAQYAALLVVGLCRLLGRREKFKPHAVRLPMRAAAAMPRIRIILRLPRQKRADGHLPRQFGIATVVVVVVVRQNQRVDLADAERVQVRQHGLRGLVARVEQDILRVRLQQYRQALPHVPNVDTQRSVRHRRVSGPSGDDAAGERFQACAAR